MSKKKDYVFTNDRMFKTLMDRENFRLWLSKSLLYVTGIDISGLDLLPTELTEGNNKQYVLDTLLKDKENNYVIIEMQNTPADFKNLRYLYRVAGNVGKKGKKDKDIKSNVTLIQFDGYIPYRNITGNILHITFQDNVNNIVKEGIEMYEIILPNFEGLCYNEYVKRLAMLACDKIEDMEQYATSKESQEVLGELIELNNNELLRFAIEKEEYDALVKQSEKEFYERQGREQGLEQGLEKGLEQGLEQGRSEERDKLLKVLSMLNQNKSDSKIISTLGITQEDLDEIKSTINKDN